MRDNIRVGLIGCGRIAQLIHLQVLKNLPHVRLVALAESDPQRLREAAHCVPGVLAVPHYHDLLACSDVEAVVICLPTGMHATAAMAAFQHGKHVYIEKPLASHLAEAQDVLEAWKSSGKIGVIGFNQRFHPGYLQAKQQLDQGRIGNLVGARSVFCSATRSLPDWKQNRVTGGGALLDLASHHIDLVRFLFDQEICEVAAAVRSLCSEDDTVCLELRLKNGFMVQSFFSMTAVEEDRFEIYGDRGKLTIDRYAGAELLYTPPRRRFGRLDRLGAGLAILSQTCRRLLQTLVPPIEPSFRAALTAFVESIYQGNTAHGNLLDGYRALAVIAAAEMASKRKGPISLRQPDVPGATAASVSAAPRAHP